VAHPCSPAVSSWLENLVNQTASPPLTPSKHSATRTKTQQEIFQSLDFLLGFGVQCGLRSGLAGGCELEEQRFLAEFLRVERPLAAYLLSATGDVHAADDLLQAVASVLWEKRGDYDPSRPFGAWAMGVAHLEILKWRQRAARSREFLSEDSLRLLAETATRNAADIDERYYFLAECVQLLGEKARRILQMKYVEGRKIREIAGGLEKSVAAIEMTLVRSRRDLRDCIQRKLTRSR
jgi:RNA polymerase sigma-70 factor (ECF subfamily)